MAVISLLAGNSKAAATLNHPSCLAKLVGNEVVMNSGSKANIRNALRSTFETLSPTNGASFWVRGAGQTLMRGDAKAVGNTVTVQHVLIDGAAAMRKPPNKNPGDNTGADVTLQVLAYFVGRQKGLKKVCWIEDLGDELTKWP